MSDVTPEPVAAPEPEPAPGYVAAPVPGVLLGPRSPLLMGAIGVVLVIAGVANCLLFNMSPGGPVEGVLAYGSGFSWLLTGLALGIVGIVLSRRGNAAMVGRPGIDGLSITSVSLAGAAVVVWAILGGFHFLQRVLTGVEYRYMEDVNGAFFAGIPWMLAIIFGAISFREGRSTSNLLSLIGIGVGILLLIPTLASGVIYGLHLSP
ncbi:hypothetical protein EYE40_08125 [Glaciihabitans arcticus]|uniref:Uncharacterized protein n=1 Tax=Glaciihabitans arcticus TaxID=2668039 RepID=A0A4Q9GR22_9MICO|nr:hypothetical protein [Glaciihabitans arcticus]TBN57366.1 hypothetical protein EYE40_08125 [Glaciihabitans arcticus]